MDFENDMSSYNITPEMIEKWKKELKWKDYQEYWCDGYKRFYPSNLELEEETVGQTKVCPDCKGTGKITLFTSTRECSCQKK